MQFFLVKTDPDTYSVADLQKEGSTIWDGVHNYAAIGFIKQMEPGDEIFLYESQGPKAIVGLGKVAGKPFENKDDSRFSWAVRIQFAQRFSRPLTLAEIKADPTFKEFKLVRESRLSVMPVPDEMARKLFMLLGQ